MAESIDDQMITLSDGRRLGFAEYGRSQREGR